MSDTPTSSLVKRTAFSRESRRRIRSLRQATVLAIIVSLSAAAVVGIVTLAAGTYGDLQTKIMMTILVVGCYGIVLLCDLAVAGRRLQWVGFAGIVFATACMIVCFILLWGELGRSDLLLVGKMFSATFIFTVGLAHINLLLLLATRTRLLVRVGMWVTIGLVVVVGVMFLILVLGGSGVAGDLYGRFLGGAAILDALGSIVVPVIGAIFPDEPGPEALTAAVPVELPAELVARVEERATAGGMSTRTYVAQALEDLVGRD